MDDKARGRVVVTGAAGMLGQNLVPRLCAAGWKVIGLDKNPGTLRVLGERAPEAELHVADLAEPRDWMNVFTDSVAVVDAKAQITSPDRNLHLRNNAMATSNVLEACARHQVPHLIHMSSSVVISKADDFYTESKRLGEESVRESRVPHTILRPPLMYGPGDIKHLGLILGLMERFPAVPVPGDGKYLRQPLFVGDMCSVIERALGRAPGREVFNVIGHERIMFIDLLKTIRRVKGSRCLLMPIPTGLFKVALAVQKVVLGRLMFTGQQLAALTAGDDFPVEDWARTFDVAPTTFESVAARVYGPDDELRVRLIRRNRMAGRDGDVRLGPAS